MPSGKKHLDVATHQATLKLEERIMAQAQLGRDLVGEDRVNQAFKEGITKTVLRVASNKPEDQRGFTQLLRGMVHAFRNKTHHHIVDFSQQEALRVVGFVDVL